MCVQADLDTRLEKLTHAASPSTQLLETHDVKKNQIAAEHLQVAAAAVKTATHARLVADQMSHKEMTAKTVATKELKNAETAVQAAERSFFG